jgi:hypothetical protein
MISETFSDDEFLSRLDLAAIEDARNKIDECEFFLGMACQEPDRTKFRWLVSAFLSAAYSYFEMTALRAYFGFTSPDTGEPLPDLESISILRDHVVVLQDQKRPEYVKTAGKSSLTKKLYEVRRRNTHHFPLAIMEAGPSLPEDFHFGNMRGEGEGVLPLCRDALVLIHKVQAELAA